MHRQNPPLPALGARTRLFKFFLIVSATLASGPHLVAPAEAAKFEAAKAEIVDMDDGLRATTEKERLKQSLQSDSLASAGNGNSGCGQVEIGNGPANPSAQQQISPRQTTVVVAGPVINMASCR